MDKVTFINLVKDGAIKAQQKYGICASLTMAQAALETGWGEHAPGNNMFGIKWNEGCGYGKQLLSTKEFISGIWRTIKDYFRAYESLADSLYDHAMFLVENSRYKNLLGVKDYKVACRLIKEDGYATAPDYTQQLIQIIEENNLNRFDNIQPVGGTKKVKNVVIYDNDVNRRAADYLADALDCPVISAEQRFDYTTVEQGGVLAVVNAATQVTTYVAKRFTGKDRFDTCQKVLDFIKAGCK